MRALDGVDLAIEAGELVALEGPSGSGKTTLLQLLGGLDRPSAGASCFEGRDLASAPRRDLAGLRLRSFGYVFQQFNLIPTLTALENVEAALAPTGVGRASCGGARLLDEVGLTERATHLPAICRAASNSGSRSRAHSSSSRTSCSPTSRRATSTGDRRRRDRAARRPRRRAGRDGRRRDARRRAGGSRPAAASRPRRKLPAARRVAAQRTLTALDRGPARAITAARTRPESGLSVPDAGRNSMHRRRLLKLIVGLSAAALLATTAAATAGSLRSSHAAANSYNVGIVYSRTACSRPTARSTSRG